jgi:predicted membrane-bound dolichyl-phosphate-mannose-protein mannosyltransferase
MPRRLQALASGRPSLPLLLLAAVCVISLAARGAWLSQPCHSPCRTARDRVLIFDERYYVNAARVIAGIYPPLGSPYANAPLGVDPNSEHPQLAKLVIAGSIELFGDGPLAWRLGSLVAGTLAILGTFALVRAAGGGRWTALAAAGLMAADNLMIVHGRIGTLDVYALAAMVWAAALYLRGRPLIAGLVIAVGLCTKLVVSYVLLVLALVELLQWLGPRERPLARLRRLVGCSATAAAGFLVLLAALDRVAAPYDDATRKLVSGGPFGHLGHMIRYAAQQTSPHGPRGIASYPWGWLVDYKPITYLNVNPARPAVGLFDVHPAVHFLGLISPPILLLALPALALAARTAMPRRIGPDHNLAILAVAWFAGTFLPFVVLSVVWKRTSYLYYMVIVMPGLYVAAGWLLTKTRRWPRVKVLWFLSVLAAAVLAYPFTPLP